MYNDQEIAYYKMRGELSRQKREYMKWLQDHPNASWIATSEIRARLADIILQLLELDKQNINIIKINLK